MGATISRPLCQGVIEAQSWLLSLNGRTAIQWKTSIQWQILQLSLYPIRVYFGSKLLSSLLFLYAYH